VVLDFSEKDFFTGDHTITPAKMTRAKWQSLFQIALDDLVGLMAPERVVFCEGAPHPDIGGKEEGRDAIVLNQVFGSSHPETLFVSAGGNSQTQRHSSLALKVLQKAFLETEVLLLRDRDQFTDTQRNSFLAGAQHHRMFERHEIENYLFDSDVLRHYAAKTGHDFELAEYGKIVTDIQSQDLKAGSTLRKLCDLCGFSGEPEELLVELAEHVEASGSVFQDMERCIFA